MKVCFLSSMHAPTDKRVFQKEARTLAAAGFDVVHLAPGGGPNDTVDGVRLVVYRAEKTIGARLLSMYRLYKRAAAIGADVYHCNEVDSWVVGVVLKALRRSVVVFDVHEHYPSTFARLHCPSWLSGIAERLVRLMFQGLTPLTDYFVFAKETVAPDFPRTESRSITVLNCATLGDERESDLPIERSEHACITAVHVGVFGRERGWPQLIEALRLSKSANLRVKIIGTFTDGSDEAFHHALDMYGLAPRVECCDWLPYEEMYRELQRASIGLVLFQPGIPNHVFAMPHKMFDYMKARLPVIVPEFAVEIAPIVRDERCGLLIDPSNPHQIADAIDKLAGDPEFRAVCGERGRAAVVRRYNWEEEARQLIRLYERIRATRGRGGRGISTP